MDSERLVGTDLERAEELTFRTDLGGGIGTATVSIGLGGLLPGVPTCLPPGILAKAAALKSGWDTRLGRFDLTSAECRVGSDMEGVASKAGSAEDARTGRLLEPITGSGSSLGGAQTAARHVGHDCLKRSQPLAQSSVLWSLPKHTGHCHTGSPLLISSRQIAHSPASSSSSFSVASGLLNEELSSVTSS